MERGLVGTKRLLQRAGAKAAIDTTVFGSGSGRLNPEQSDRFIDYVVDQSKILKDGIRIARMNADRRDLDKVSVGTRTLRRATEGVAPTDLVGVTTSKRQLVVTEVILPADVSFTFMEDNIERDNFDDHLLQLFGTQISNDLEDLAISADTAYSGADEDFLTIEDGWLKILKAICPTGQKIDTAGGQDFRNQIFEAMLEAMPPKFKANKSALRFYVSTNDELKYRFQVGQRNTAGGDSVLLGDQALPYGGVPVIGAPYMPEGTVVLTLPDNLVMGIRRNIEMGLFKNERKRVWEYTWTMRIDFQVVEGTAAVIAYDQS